MSADLEGSTAYKQQPGRSSDHEILKPFFVFLKEFGGEMDEQRRKLGAEMPNHLMPSAPQPWKILGDELIYFVELERPGDADLHIMAFQGALQKINSEEP